MLVRPIAAAAFITSAVTTAALAPLPVTAEEITLRAVSSFQEKTSESERFEEMIQAINKRGAGKLKINYLGGTPKVMGPFEVVTNLKAGVIDFANANSAFFTNVVPEADAFKLTEYTIQELRANGGYQVLNQILNEKANAYLLGNHLEHIGFHIYLNKPITKADLTGLKIRVTPIYRAMVEALGGTAINSPPSEVYTLLERNTVDGYGWPSVGIFQFSWDKVTKYRVDPPFYSASLHTLVNLNVWNKLNAEQKKLLQDVMAEFEATNTKRIADNAADMEKQEKAGIKAIKLTGADEAKWRTTAYDAAWAVVTKNTPQMAPKLKEVLMKKK